MKKCSKCNVEKPLNEYYSNRPDCKQCKRDTTNTHYEKTQDARRLYSKERRNKMKLKCIEYLGSVCADCGKSYHQACFDFHHLDPTKKDKEVGSLMSASWENVKKELDKCVLLCSNCHRVRHFV